VACALLAAAMPAWASDDAIDRCRLERAAEKRLACYDAIQTGPRAAASLPLPSAAPGLVPPQAPVPANTFGLSKSAAEQQGVSSSISGRFEGWGPKTQFKLANGQIWEVEDGSNASLWLDSPKISVRKGFAGAYYLEVEGSNRSPRVRRLK
jgi:hypothetical protein